MKHLLALALLSATSAFAHGSSHPPQSDSTSPTGMVSFDGAPRTATYNYDRNETSVDGQILVCPRGSFTDWRAAGDCLTKAGGVNDWRLLTTMVPTGFKIKGYEYRFVGSSGSRILVVYFEPITAPKTEFQKADEMHFTGPITIKADAINVTSGKVYIRRKK
jgi:hypothetical protein